MSENIRLSDRSFDIIRNLPQWSEIITNKPLDVSKVIWETRSCFPSSLVQIAYSGAKSKAEIDWDKVLNLKIAALKYYERLRESEYELAVKENQEQRERNPVPIDTSLRDRLEDMFGECSN